MDFASGYWQLMMDPKSVDLTAFSTPSGHYEFLRMPFGLKNAPADFCRTMHIIFGNTLQCVQVYFDDITIHSKTFDEHLKDIMLVLNILKKYDIKLKKSKCKWISSSVKVLGLYNNDSASKDGS